MTALTMLEIQKKRKECFTIKGKQRFNLIDTYLLNNNCQAVGLGHYSEATQYPVWSATIYDYYFIIDGELTDALLAKLFELGMKVKKAKQGTYFQG